DPLGQIVAVDVIPEFQLVDRRDLVRRQRLHLVERGVASEKRREGRLRDAEIGGPAGVFRVVDEAAFELQREREALVEIVLGHASPRVRALSLRLHSTEFARICQEAGGRTIAWPTGAVRASSRCGEDRWL